MKSIFPKVIYIMGHARSGSTILELIISNNADIEGLGEVTHIFRDVTPKSSTNPNVINSQHVWNKVLDRCLKSRKDRLRAQLLFNRVRNHWLFPFIFAGMVPHKMQQQYAFVNECIFIGIAEETGGTTVVDSSKYPGRALLLAKLFPDHVKVLCLTRDAGGVVNSFSKKYLKHTYQGSFIKVTIYYVYILTCMYIVRQFLSNSELSIRYEDLQLDPESTLISIEKWLKSDMSNSRRVVNINGRLDIGLGITGNIYCRQGDVIFRSDVGSYTRTNGVKGLIISLMDKYRTWLGF